MFGRLMPREGRFFELFNELSEELVHGARELAALITSGEDIERRAYAIESSKSAVTRSRTQRSSCSTALLSRLSIVMTSISWSARWTISST